MPHDTVHHDGSHTVKTTRSSNLSKISSLKFVALPGKGMDLKVFVCSAHWREGAPLS